MIGYLSGPITGHKNYRQQFARAAGALRSWAMSSSIPQSWEQPFHSTR